MVKNPKEIKPKRKKRDEVASVIADIHGVTARYVRMVIDGKATNHDIMESYLNYKHGKNLLIEAVKKAVPFN